MLVFIWITIFAKIELASLIHAQYRRSKSERRNSMKLSIEDGIKAANLEDRIAEGLEDVETLCHELVGAQAALAMAERERDEARASTALAKAELAEHTALAKTGFTGR
jgi:hypothetical protein